MTAVSLSNSKVDKSFCEKFIDIGVIDGPLSASVFCLSLGITTDYLSDSLLESSKVSAVAATALGYCYQFNIGICDDDDNRLSKECYIAAAKCKDPRARYLLAWNLQKGFISDDCKSNDHEKVVLKLYKKSANTGYLPAIHELAHCYLAKQENTKAMKLFETAAALGFKTSKVELEKLQEQPKQDEKA